MATDRLVRELLQRGTDDWIDASEVAWIAQSLGGARSDEEVLDTSIDLVRRVLTDSLMEIGDVTDGGFFAWDRPTDEAIAKAEREWRALGRRPDLGEVFWLENTKSGDLRARSDPGYH